MSKNLKELMEKLQNPFSAEEISFRITAMNGDKTKGQVVAYVNNSAIQNRLDEVFTPFGWQCSFRDWKNGNAQICTISVYDEEKDDWISKEDGAENTNISSIKGGLSDSMKRCARMFGIGRYLVSDKVLKTTWVTLDDYKNIPKETLGKLQNEYNQYLNGQRAASKPRNTATYNQNSAGIQSSSYTASQNTANSINNNKNGTSEKPYNTDKVSSNKSNKQVENNSNGKEPTSGQELFNKPQDTQKAKLPQPLSNAILLLLQQNNTSIESLLNHYHVKSLIDLSMQQANDAIKKLTTSNNN